MKKMLENYFKMEENCSKIELEVAEAILGGLEPMAWGEASLQRLKNMEVVFCLAPDAKFDSS